MTVSRPTFRLQVTRLDKTEARRAARLIDDVLLPLDVSLDLQDCILMGLRGRVRSKLREVPRAAWPELRRFLDETPGLLRSLTPYREVDEAERRELIGELMYFHVIALTEGDIDPLLVLASEGLLNALIAEPQRIAGHELLDFVTDVRKLARLAFGSDEKSSVARAD